MKAKAKKRNIVVRTCKQRACGVFALVMVFVCGLMLGIGGQKCVVKLSARLQSAQGANAEQSQPKETCRVIEGKHNTQLKHLPSSTLFNCVHINLSFQ